MALDGGGAGPGRTWRPGVYLNGATIMTTPTPALLDVAREAGFDGVEVRAERLLVSTEEAAATADAVRPGEVWSVNGIQVQLTRDGRLDRGRLDADVAPRLEICRAVGAAYLLVVPPRIEGVDPARALAEVRDGVAVVRDRAAAAGIRVAFEVLGFGDCPIDTPARAGELVRELAGVDAVLDSCHWHASGGGSLDEFPVDRLAMVHLNDAPAKEPRAIEDADRLLPGEGVIPLRALLADLIARGYAGPVSLETFNPDHWRLDPAAVAADGRAALARLFAEASTVGAAPR